MTTRELVVLLERAQELGGPISSGNPYWYADPPGEAGIAVAIPVSWRDSWLLIGAFTLDAEKRGWSTNTYLTGQSWMAVFWTNPNPSKFKKAEAPTLLGAVLRAWIAARENES